MVDAPPREHRPGAGAARSVPRWVWLSGAVCVGALLLAATLWVVFGALGYVRTVSVAVVVALLLTALLDGLVQPLQRLHLPRWLAALTALLLLVAVVVAALVLVVDRAVSQVSDLRGAVTKVVGQGRDYLTGPPLSLPQDRLDKAQQALVHGLSNVAPSPGAGTAMVLSFLSGLVLTLFVLFFFLKDGQRISQWLLSWTPSSRRERVDEAGRRAWRTLTAYVRATVLVAAVDALGIGAGMLALHVPLTASLTLVTFVGAFVPIVGATVSGALAVAVTLVTVGPVQALILLGVVLAVQQLEGNVLQPLIMGRALDLHPLVTVLSVSVGVMVGGIAGAVVAVPAVAVSYRVLSYLSGREP